MKNSGARTSHNVIRTCVVFMTLIAATFTQAVSSTGAYKLSPPSKINDSQVKAHFALDAVCALVERRASYGRKLSEITLQDIASWKNTTDPALDGCVFNAHPEKGEVTIDISAEGLAVRYFDPEIASVITPYIDILRLRTERLAPGSSLYRQVIHRTKAISTTVVPLKVAVITPKSISDGYSKLLTENLNGLGLSSISVDMKCPAKGEDIKDFADKVRKAGYDFAFVVLHGAQEEVPVAFEDYGCKNVIIPIRPGEVLMRHGNGIYPEEAWNRVFSGASATVILGGARAADYGKFSGNVITMPVGFSRIPEGPAKEKHFEEGIVIGARTLWSDMRSMKDVIALVKEVRKNRGGQKAFGYIAGKLADYKDPVTGKTINEAVMLDGNPDCVFLKAVDIAAAYNKDNGFNDLASYKRWLRGKLGGASVIIVTGDIENKEAEAVESEVVDFSDEMYHEIMNDFRPKDEYSAAIHRNSGKSIALGFDSDAIRDMMAEGISIIPVEFGTDGPDFARAARDILNYVSRPAEYYAQLERTWNAAKGYTIRDMATRFLDLIMKTIKPSGSTPAGAMAAYISGNKELFSQTLGQHQQDTLLRAPIEVIEQMDPENARSFIQAFQASPNGYVELYCMSGAGNTIENMIRKYMLKPVPEGFNRTRQNTITLVPAFKGEELSQTGIVTRIGNIKPGKTVLSPLGLQNDSAGLIRAAMLGLKIMQIARAPDAFDNDEVQRRVLEDLKVICDIDDMTGLAAEDIMNLAMSDNINAVIASLNKLIKILPIAPIDAGELREIFERAKEVITAA